MFSEREKAKARVQVARAIERSDDDLINIRSFPTEDARAFRAWAASKGMTHAEALVYMVRLARWAENAGVGPGGKVEPL
jgi:hypothetical protein